MRFTQEEWLAKLKENFGEDKLAIAFTCPACGKVSTAQKFKDAGAEDYFNDVYQKCIGRLTGKGAAKNNSKDGCDWAAFGLLGTLGKGDVVVSEDGEKTDVFQMAIAVNS